MWRMEDNNVARVRYLAEFDNAPRQVGVLTEILEALIKALHPRQEVAAIEHVSGHETKAFESHIGYRAEELRIHVVGANTAFQPGPGGFVEITSGLLQPVRLGDAVVIREGHNQAGRLLD